MNRHGNNTENEKKQISLSISTDLLQKIDSDREGTNMNRSAYICEILKSGKVVQMHLPEEDRKLFRDILCELQLSSKTIYTIMLDLRLSGELTPQIEASLNEGVNNIVRIRKYLDQYKGEAA